MDIKTFQALFRGQNRRRPTAARTLANPHLDHGITVTLMDIKMDIKTFQALFRGQNRITCPWQYSADPTSAWASTRFYPQPTSSCPERRSRQQNARRRLLGRGGHLDRLRVGGATMSSVAAAAPHHLLLPR
jgi:hypothetical protein